MKRFLSGLACAVGLIVALAGVTARFLPVDRIVFLAPWLGFVARILALEPYWLYLTIGGGAVFAGAGAWHILERRREARELDALSAAPAPLDQSGQMYQADNADIRARVRDLLRWSWGGPLIALALGILPIAAVHAGVHIFLRPFQTVWTAASAVITEFANPWGGLRLAIPIIATGTLPDFTAIADDLLRAAPGIALLIVAWALVFQPTRVSRSGYFLRLLYGNKPSPLTTLGCFRDGYARAVGGMAYAAMWLALWALLALAAPIGIYAGGMAVVNMYPEELNPYLLWILPSLAGLTALSFILLAWRLVNRWLAYSFAPCVISSQKGLPARRAVRASRYLTRGHKLRLLGMWMSFLYYFLPAICAMALSPLVGPLGGVLGFTEYLSVTLRRFFLIVTLANQLLWLYVGPLAWSSFYAFYLEMKRDYRENYPTRLYILGILPQSPATGRLDATTGRLGATPRESTDTQAPLRRRHAHANTTDIEDSQDQTKTG
ncbi:MAG: hypothetical protein LBS11_09880 [Oscillospiraceae bacterium]|nr:hypothetical protein [Oscillospiraceae bacterium]